MPQTQLGEPILDGGIRSVNFCNGRVLTAENLKAEQVAQRAHRLLLGRALGPGVVSGLDVRIAADGVALVSPGLAVSPSGEVLRLPLAVELVVVSDRQPGSTGGGGGFGDYKPGPVGMPVPSLGVLTLCSAASGEGVQFRLIPCPLPADAQPYSTLRNRLAYRCFATGGASGLVQLTQADVPLALVGIMQGRLWFIDMWAVRAPGSPEAMARQFQAELSDLLGAPGAAGDVLRAVDHFRFLPPAGRLPTGPGDVRLPEFFQPLQVEAVDLDPAFVRPWMEQVQAAEPVDLSDPPPLWLYQPEGAEQAVFLRRERPRVISYANTATVMVDLLLPGRRASLEPVVADIYAATASGRRYRAQLLGRRYVITGLPPGPCTVWAVAPGCRPVASRQRPRAGETVSLLLELLPLSGPGQAPRPSDSVPPGTWLPAFMDLVAKPESARWAELPEALQAWRPTETPAPVWVTVWLTAWGDWLAAKHPEMGIDPQNPILLVNPAVLRDAKVPPPHAVVIFGDGGAYMPLELTVPAEQPQPDPGGILEPGPAGEVAAAEQPVAPGAKPGLVKRFWHWLIAAEER
jgi:hypothetical protein